MYLLTRIFTSRLHIPSSMQFSSVLSPSRPLPSLEIQLTKKENELCEILDACSKQIAQKRPEIPPVECRIAGGWVRDKLLGMDSNDIDVALSTMMGVPFAEHLVNYMSSRGETIHEPTKIERNPEQSKHLETAMVHILGLDIDLVNLRSEEYTEGSRIPSGVAFGTPLEDALRRDITINSLFYNVHTRSVEDFTGKGLEDLKNGVVRTPLSPRETFMDDPLRVLRCVRFASRYGYEIERTAVETIRQPDIQSAVQTKISRERVGIEVDKMLKGKHPLLALEMIESLRLHPSVFWLPGEIMSRLSEEPGPRTSSLEAATVLDSLISQHSGASTSPSHQFSKVHPTLLNHTMASPETRQRLYLASALTPFKGSHYKEKNRLVSATEAVVRLGLKLGTQNHYLDGVPVLFEAHERLSNAVNNGSYKSLDDNPRVALGLLLREKSVHNPLVGAHWTSSLLFSLVQDLRETLKIPSGPLDEQASLETISRYNAFVESIEKLNLPSAIDDKPLLDASLIPNGYLQLITNFTLPITQGRRVCALLGIKPGPKTGHILARVVAWQLANPSGDAEACQSWLLSEHNVEGSRADNTDIAGKRGAEDGVGGSKKARKRT